MADAGKNSKSSSSSNSNKKKKYKFTAMDYITIGFTAIVVLLMIFFLVRSVKPELFKRKDRNSSDNAATATAAVNSPTEPAPAAPTETPEYGGIGNTYGNMANGAVAAGIDGITYYVNEETRQLTVRSESGTRAIADGAVVSGSVNVIKDPFAYGDIADSVAYLVMFLDGEGNIRALTDGPYPDPDSDAVLDSEPRATEARTLAEGNYRSFVSVGKYLYAIDRDGLVWRIAIADGEKEALSAGKYTALCVYYGEMFALGQDGGVYRLGLTPSEDNETRIIDGPVRCFAVFDDWIYTGGDNGFVRYDVDTLGKDTLSTSIKPDAVNVDKRGIFYAAGGELKLATARELLSGSGRTLGSWSGAAIPRITLTAGNTYVALASADGSAGISEIKVFTNP